MLSDPSGGIQPVQPVQLVRLVNFCIFHSGTSSACSAIQRYRFVHGHVHILIPKLWGSHFCIFHLGTSSAFSATQRCWFVHGHVHILSPKLWEPFFLNLFCAFFTWGPLVPAVLLSAIGLCMDMFIF